MKTAEEWNQEYQKLGSTRDMVEWIRQIQSDTLLEASRIVADNGVTVSHSCIRMQISILRRKLSE